MTLDRDLRAVLTSALVCTAIVAVVRVTAVRAVFAVPLCLVLPGYALTQACFPRRDLDGIRGLMLTLALSLATLVLGALLLDAVPGGLRLASWAILIAVVVAAGVGVAGWRRTGTARVRPRMARLKFRRRDVILLLVAALLASGALVLSRTPLKASNAIGYTQMWMLPSGTPGSAAVTIGIRSAEQQPTTYKLELSAGSGRPTVIYSSLTLKPGAANEVKINVSGPRVGVPTLVRADLYKPGTLPPYRQVTALVTPGK